MSAGLVPDVGSKVSGAVSIPFIDRSTGSEFPVAAPAVGGATAEKADTLLEVKAARISAVQNFMVGGLAVVEIDLRFQKCAGLMLSLSPFLGSRTSEVVTVENQKKLREPRGTSSIRRCVKSQLQLR